jgi:hypothetical protein
MSQIKIRRAFEKSLKSLDSNFQTAYENVSFTPTKDVPYQRVQLVPFEPENPTFGDNFHREVGEFQVFLCFPINNGTSAAYTKAEQIKNFYYRGLTLVEDGLEVIIRTTPAVSGGITANDRFIVPVIIEYYASII